MEQKTFSNSFRGSILWGTLVGLLIVTSMLYDLRGFYNSGVFALLISSIFIVFGMRIYDKTKYPFSMKKVVGLWIVLIGVQSILQVIKKL